MSMLQMPACFRPPHYHRIINQVDEIYIYAQNLDGSSIVIRNTCYYNRIQSPMFKLLEGSVGAAVLQCSTPGIRYR